MAPQLYEWVIIYTSLYMWCDYYKQKIVPMAADDN